MCQGCGKLWTALQVLWSTIYVICGAAQLISGIFFMISIPALHLSCNIWTGSWVSDFGDEFSIVLWGASNSAIYHDICNPRRGQLWNELVGVFNWSCGFAKGQFTLKLTNVTSVLQKRTRYYTLRKRRTCESKLNFDEFSVNTLSFLYLGQR